MRDDEANTPKQPHSKQLKLRIPANVHADLELMAWWKRRSLNTQASIIIELYLSQNEAILEEARAAQERRPIPDRQDD